MILMFTAAVGALEIDVCDVQMSSTDSIPYECTVPIRKSAMIMRISHKNKTNHSIKNPFGDRNYSNTLPQNRGGGVTKK